MPMIAANSAIVTNTTLVESNNCPKVGHETWLNSLLTSLINAIVFVITG